MGHDRNTRALSRTSSEEVVETIKKNVCVYFLIRSAVHFFSLVFFSVKSQPYMKIIMRSTSRTLLTSFHPRRHDSRRSNELNVEFVYMSTLLSIWQIRISSRVTKKWRKRYSILRKATAAAVSHPNQMCCWCCSSSIREGFTRRALSCFVASGSNIRSYNVLYFLLCNKNIRFDFDDELKIGDVRYDNMT